MKPKKVKPTLARKEAKGKKMKVSPTFERKEAMGKLAKKAFKY